MALIGLDLCIFVKSVKGTNWRGSMYFCRV